MLLAREFGWTVQEMRELYPSELAAIVSELRKQKQVWEYTELRSKWAFLAAVITNGFSSIASMFSKRKPKAVKPEDFIDKKWYKKIEGMIKGAQPSARDEWASHIADAKAKGLKGPW